MMLTSLKECLIQYKKNIINIIFIHIIENLKRIIALYKVWQKSSATFTH